MMLKHPRVKDEGHLNFIRSLRCCVCLNNIQTEAAHVRFSDPRVAKVNAGVGAKPSDRWALPLCSRDHRDQHDNGDERDWWVSKGIDPIFLAMALYSVSGDHEAGEQIVACATHKFEREFA
jgi:hypothetical protein